MGKLMNPAGCSSANGGAILRFAKRTWSGLFAYPSQSPPPERALRRIIKQSRNPDKLSMVGKLIRSNGPTL